MDPQPAGTILISTLYVKFVMVQKLGKARCFTRPRVKGIDAGAGFNPQSVGVIHCHGPDLVAQYSGIQAVGIAVFVAKVRKYAGAGIELVQSLTCTQPDV